MFLKENLVERKRKVIEAFEKRKKEEQEKRENRKITLFDQKRVTNTSDDIKAIGYETRQYVSVLDHARGNDVKITEIYIPSEKMIINKYGIFICDKPRIEQSTITTEIYLSNDAVIQAKKCLDLKTQLKNAESILQEILDNQFQNDPFAFKLP